MIGTELPEWRILGRTFVCALVLPAICVILLLEWVGWKVGETIPPDEAARIQTNHPNTVWYRYRSSSFARFKLARVAIERPDILIVGQSRPQMFRSAMFRPYSAYNLGSLSYTMASFTDLLHHLPEGYNPKVIIMASDFYMFDPLCTEANLKAHMLQDFSPPPMEQINTLRDLLVQLPSHPGMLLAGFHQAHAYPTLGLTAYLNGMGFRFDGSTHWYASFADNPDLAKDTPWGNVSMIQGNSMGSAEMAQFEQFVNEAHARGIAVVFLQLPMYDSFVHKMENEEADKYGILRDFRQHVQDGYFNRLDVPVIDLLTMPGYSDDYRYFLDIVHGKEGLALQVMNAMASDPRLIKLLPKLDRETLREKAQAERSTNHNDVYGQEY